MSRAVLILTLLLVLGVYLCQLPSTVQTGDTGELVTAGLRLLVPHPPGFPLFVWIEAFFLRLIPWGSVFWKASLLSSLLSIGSLAFLGATAGVSSFLSSGLVLVLAFSSTFWRSSLLPDVFALNALLAACLLWLYFHKEKKYELWMPFVFFLGLGNHPTLIFLAPIVLHAIWRQRRERRLMIFIGAGVLTWLSLEASLFLLHPADPLSWGQLDSFSVLWGHLTRQEYGAFQLAPGSKLPGSVLGNIWYLLAQVAWPLATGAVLFLLSWPLRKKREGKEILVLLSAVFYAGVFFSLSNVDLNGFGHEILARFVLLFEVLVIFVGGHCLRKFTESEGALWMQISGGLLLLAVGFVGLWQNFSALDFSKRSIVEDYALNFLAQMPPGTSSVALLDADTKVFALRYVQSVLGVRPDVVVVSPATLIHPWYQRKMVDSSGLSFPLSRTPGKVYLLDELILPNLGKFVFHTNLPFAMGPEYQLKPLPLGRRLEKVGSLPRPPTATLQFRSQADLVKTDSSLYDSERDLWTDYFRQPLQQAQEEIQKGNHASAQALLQDVLLRCPWCWPAQVLICALKNQTERSLCELKGQEIRTQNFDYFQ